MSIGTRAPDTETPLVEGQGGTTPWTVALERLENPGPGQNHWLATIQPDGRPHLMPIIAFWIDGAFHFIANEATQKGRNLAADDRCVIGTANLTLPSMDLIVEGRAKPIADEAEVARLADDLRSKNWPLEARGRHLYGPHGPTAGPPPYAIYRLEVTKIFGLPGMHKMFEVDEHLKPTRWTFAAE